MSVTLNGTNGLVFNDGSTQNTGATGFGFKNRIINGAMTVAQRGTSSTFSGTGQNTTSYNTVDRFSFSTFGGSFPSGVYATTAQVADAPTGFVNSFKVTANQTLTIGSSNTRGIWVAQNIEGFNLADTYNTTITISFWVKSSNIGTYSLAFQNDNGGYATSYVINAANTWEYKTVTLINSTSLGTANYTNGRGLGVVFGLGGDSTWIGTSTANQWVAGNIPYLHGCKNLFDTANATWQITGVQLEKGSTATSFDYRPYGTELALCQRYYEKSYDISTTPNTNTNTGLSIFNGTVDAAGSSYQGVLFKVSKRAAPTVTLISHSGTNGQWQGNYSASNGLRTAIADSSSTENFWFHIVVGGSWVSCQVYGHYVAVSEL